MKAYCLYLSDKKRTLVRLLHAPHCKKKTLAPICNSPSSTMFSGLCCRQTDKGRPRQKKKKAYPVLFQSTYWLFLKWYTSLHYHVVLGRQESVVVMLILIPALHTTHLYYKFHIYHFTLHTVKCCLSLNSRFWSLSSKKKRAYMNMNSLALLFHTVRTLPIY